jgi:outer membrane protein OmpA-like peptidoglycan-associated protein
MKSLPLIFLGLLGISLLSFFCFMLHRSVIETELSQNTRTALVHNSMEWVTPTANGQIITLTGIATNNKARLHAESTAKAIEGVTQVNNQISLASATNSAPKTAQNLSSTITNKDKADFSITAPDAEISTNTDDRKTTEVANVEKAEATTNSTTEIAQPTTKASSTLVATPANETNAPNPSTIKNETSTTQTTNQTETTKNAINTCQQQFNQQLSNEKIRFKISSAILSANSSHLIIQLAKTAQSCPQFNIIIAGHTDSSGLDTMNQKLSEQRAQSVYNALVKHGINASTLSAIGYGETQPIAANNTQQGKAQNRRIEFKVQEN